MTMPNGQVVNGFWKNGQNVQIESNPRVNGASMITSLSPAMNGSSGMLSSKQNSPPFVGSRVLGL